MTRRNKRAARFGDRYRPPIDWRRFRDGLQKAQPAIHRMTEAFRRYHERQLVAALRAAGWATWLRPQEGLELGEDGRYRRRQPDILDRIDDTLLTYDSQHATGDQPWPYRGF